MAYKAEIPYGCYWSTPFARWQGAFAHLHRDRVRGPRGEARAGAARHSAAGLRPRRARLQRAAEAFVLRAALAQRAGRSRAGRRPDADAGLRHRRARAAGRRRRRSSAGWRSAALAVTCDRTSNGPHLYYPNPRGPGGTGAHEDWVMDNFSCDPLGRHAMVTTAENVAKKHGIDTAEQHEWCCGASAVPRRAGRRLPRSTSAS